MEPAVMSPDGLLASVIVPVFNGERYLAETLDSIFGQMYPSLEVIVVDDGSTDRSAEIACSYPDVHYLSQANTGPAASRNRGIAAAHGEFLAFLDADDLWTPDKLQVQMAFLQMHPEVPGVCARFQNFMEPGIGHPPWMPHDRFQAIEVGYSCCTLTVHRSVFDAVGLFNAAYTKCEDTEWFFRATVAGVKIPVLPAVLMHRRLHGANLSYEETGERLSLPLERLRAVIARRRREEGSLGHDR